jgi:hypothetical protein
MAQPALVSKEPFEYDRDTGQYSPLEIAGRIGLGMESLADAARDRLGAVAIPASGTAVQNGSR